MKRLIVQRTSSRGKIQFARRLRQEQTDAEKMLWVHLRDRRLGGHKFRRQQPIGPFVADFFCSEVRLVVEIDGAIHDTDEQQKRDRLRQAALNKHDLRVIRFTNEEVLTRIAHVLNQILEHITILSPLSPRERGRG